MTTSEIYSYIYTGNSLKIITSKNPLLTLTVLLSLPPMYARGNVLKPTANVNRIYTGGNLKTTANRQYKYMICTSVFLNVIVYKNVFILAVFLT